jgi:hypothetical protein
MKDFTMSIYTSKEELYKAKAEYYENKFKFAVSLLADALSSDDSRCCDFLGASLYDQIDEFIKGVEGE